MGGKLIIHIGPPKTATTSLQYYWMALKIPGFKYLGIIQPRKNNSFSSKLYNYVNSKHDNNSYENELVKELGVYILKYKYTVISEEMFLLEGTITFEEKLEKLFRLVYDFQPILTFCVRDAMSVYFSYYLEIFSSLSRDLQNNFAKFQESSYCDCYRYKNLYNKIIHLGFNKVNIFYFKDLVAGLLTMEEILGIEDSLYSFKVKLDQTNAISDNNKDLIVRKKGLIESIIIKTIKIVPSAIKVSDFAGKFLYVFKNKKYVKIKMEPVNHKTEIEYINDLKFLQSLKYKN